MNATVAIATYGADHWVQLAEDRARPSAEAEGVRVVHVHAANLAEARNGALSLVETLWVIHLDADDELEPGYVEAMSRGTADLRAPSVRYVRGGKAARPQLPRVVGHRHTCRAECLPEGNFICIGAAVRTELLRSVGGWGNEDIYEDWAAWLRCWRAGGTIEAIPAAVYRAHVRPRSRNVHLPVEARRRALGEIPAAA